VFLCAPPIPSLFATHPHNRPVGIADPLMRPEAHVFEVENAGDPAARVQAAVETLGITLPAVGKAAGRTRRGGDGAALDPQRRPTILDYHRSYCSGTVTPSDVAESILHFLETEQGSANWFCECKPDHVRAQAAAATQRYAAGKPLSVLDGVPYGLKDVVDAFAHKSGSGTVFLGNM